MNSKCFLLIPLAALALVLVTAGADAPRDSGVMHFDHTAVDALFAKGGVLLATNNFKVMGLRRTQPGEVEIHDTDTDVFYVLEGSAQFVTGGQALEPRRTGPGEVRARSITGGRDQHLAKGDVIVIPNGVPHWFKQVSNPFVYFVVKVSK